ncbi:MAG: peptidoglycan -binding protein [Alphaproteobacteria bacterium]|nr:peptidoglycan -binding protein [Rhodospirillales bacterium]MCW9046233.1 peptidoglycan -binding protein [Alphaproteobacteria bacterium]
MAGLATRRRRGDTNTWPGFVDALATLLMVIIFLLMIFVLAQFFLSQALTGRDKALDHLRGQVSELASLLALERKTNEALQIDISQLSQELQSSVVKQDDLSIEAEKLLRAGKSDKEALKEKITEANRLAAEVEALNALKEELQEKLSKMAGRLDENEKGLLKEQDLSKSARAEVALLNKQLKALREQMAALNATLEASEELAKKQKVQITNLGSRLNAALAGKVQELSRYRSEFFGRLKEVLGRRKDLTIVGDRFVFQSEVLFTTGSADLGEPGKIQLQVFAETLKEIAAKIPNTIQWILRVDGHTDRVPIKNWKYPSNWELASARAISVVKFLIDQGIPAERLAATGFAQYQPLAEGKNQTALKRNRRIEMKLTQQ